MQRKEKGTHSEKRHMQRPGVRKVVAPGGCYVVSDGGEQKGGGGVWWGDQVLGTLGHCTDFGFSIRGTLSKN